MYQIKFTSKYKKDYKRIKTNTLLTQEINEVVFILSKNDAPLPEKYNDHPLKGEFSMFRECHIRPDWLLVYQKTKKDLILMLMRTGTHSHIFG
jgi:mRNA interferase YafQ